MARESSKTGAVTLILLTCSLVLGVVDVWLRKPTSVLPYVFVLGTACTAALLMFFLAGLLPHLMGKGWPRFPLTLSIPLAFESLLVATVVICWNTGDALVQPIASISAILLWLSPGPLVVLFVLQFAALSLLGLERPVRE